MFCLVSANAINPCKGADVGGHCTVHMPQGTIKRNKDGGCAFKNLHNPESSAIKKDTSVNSSKKYKTRGK